MYGNAKEKMSTPISQLINHSENNSESIPDIIVSSDSPKEILHTNAINYNQAIHTDTIKTIQEIHPQNNQIFRPEYGMMPLVNASNIIIPKKENVSISDSKKNKNCKNDSFFDNFKSLIIITLLFVLLANKKVYLIIKQYLPFFNNFSSSLPRLVLRGFILGLLYLVISKFLSI
jgi:hypothetical protein